MRVYTRSELDAMRCADPHCQDPTCGDLVIGGRCHPTAPVRAVYRIGSGALELVCSVCGRHVAAVHVGDRDAAFPPCIASA